MVTVMSVMRKLTRSINATAIELDKNAIDVSLIILNKKIEVGRKIIGGATTVSNIRGKMKKH